MNKTLGQKAALAVALISFIGLSIEMMGWVILGRSLAGLMLQGLSR
jgi:hypothetical protein